MVGATRWPRRGFWSHWIPGHARHDAGGRRTGAFQGRCSTRLEGEGRGEGARGTACLGRAPRSSRMKTAPDGHRPHPRISILAHHQLGKLCQHLPACLGRRQDGQLVHPGLLCRADAFDNLLRRTHQDLCPESPWGSQSAARPAPDRCCGRREVGDSVCRPASPSDRHRRNTPPRYPQTPVE